MSGHTSGIGNGLLILSLIMLVVISSVGILGTFLTNPFAAALLVGILAAAFAKYFDQPARVCLMAAGAGAIGGFLASFTVAAIPGFMGNIVGAVVGVIVTLIVLVLSIVILPLKDKS